MAYIMRRIQRPRPPSLAVAGCVPSRCRLTHCASTFVTSKKHPHGQAHPRVPASVRLERKLPKDMSQYQQYPQQPQQAYQQGYPAQGNYNQQQGYPPQAGYQPNYPPQQGYAAQQPMYVQQQPARQSNSGQNCCLACCSALLCCCALDAIF
ncbi:hypothetical protein BCR37DRAFT_384637 [Protomyces lactucae-debilis]|uniref:Cysteine-rich transmembrane domain-containing protein n=1 Tax=Protomyces lactucae-debilis TaxID=2754530 RepID=A0A1Y2EQU1_PROLT|nr:uncharacterized protein BCR37DRAFT_384637 [Protomyces lactucae-debilis]ORY73919.1 hypothetical protein BCR37DRAFT_384637 [Protomyces lactucae-debilis]